MKRTKRDMLWTWVKVWHKMDDLDETNLSDTEKLKELNRLFYVKERKIQTDEKM